MTAPFTIDKYPRPPRYNASGVHWTPTQYNAEDDQMWAIEEVAAMGMKWVTLLDDGGGSSLKVNPHYGVSLVEALLQKGIMPVIRMMEPCDHRVIDRNMQMIEALAVLSASYDFSGCYWFHLNECEIDREWDDEEVPPNWLQIAWSNFKDAAYQAQALNQQMIADGRLPADFRICTGTPALTSCVRFDENGNQINPFLHPDYTNSQERQDLFVLGACWANIHNYAKNKPIDAPYDSVNLAGTPMIQEEFDAKLAEVDADYRTTQRPWVWHSWEVVASLNNDRLVGMRQGDDVHTVGGDVCFGMYSGMLDLIDTAGLQPYVPMGTTEGAIPVVDNREDGRYPRNTPQHQIAFFLKAMDIIHAEPNYLFATMWCVGVSRLGIWTADGYEGDGLYTDRHNEPFGLQGTMPLVDYLKKNPVGGMQMASKLFFHIQEYRNDVEAALKRSQPPYVKLMGFALKPEVINKIESLVPDVRIIGRYHVENQVYEDDPIGRATDLVNAIEATGCGPLCWAWESYNEVPTSHMTPEQVDAYDQFMLQFHRLVADRFKVEHTIVINSPVANLGWPGEVMPAQFHRTLALEGTIVSFHCYERWKDPTARDAFLFRWKELKRQIDTVFPGKKYLLTEIGVTRATIPGEADVGWRSGDGYSRYDYMGVLRDVDTEMQADENVLGGAVFQTGGAGDWPTFESAEEVADLRQNFIPIPPPGPPIPPPPPGPQPSPTPPGTVNDAVAYGVSIEEADVAEGELYWKALLVHHLSPAENRGNHNAYVNLFDEDCNDLAGPENDVSKRPGVLMGWPTGSAVIKMEKPWPDEPMGNAPVWNNQVVSLTVRSELACDSVVGIHTGHPDEPRLPDGSLGNSLYHHSYLVVWQLVVKGSEPEPPEPPQPVPEETLEMFALRKGWDAMGIRFNRDAALYKHSVKHNLGRPTSNEFDFTYDGVAYRGQGFEKASAFVPIGDWGNVQHVFWT